MEKPLLIRMEEFRVKSQRKSLSTLHYILREVSNIASQMFVHADDTLIPD